MSFRYILYGSLALLVALFAKVAFRVRADRRRVGLRGLSGCAHCDGVLGTHAPWCRRDSLHAVRRPERGQR